MTKEEFGKIAVVLKTYYPTDNFLPNKESVELWYYQLKDLDYKLMQAVINKWVATNKWQPSIAELREMALEISMGKIPSWSEAWEEVMNAIRKYGAYGAPEALTSMHPLTQEVVSRIGFSNLCMVPTETIGVEMSHFRRIYEAMQREAQIERALPDSLQEHLKELRDGKEHILLTDIQRIEKGYGIPPIPVDSELRSGLRSGLKRKE